MNAVVETREPKPSWLAQVSARWNEVLEDPCLQDLPYKVETDRAGRLVLNPTKNVHGFYRARIGALLQRSLSGSALSGCSVGTQAGVKVADVAWCSDAFLAEHGMVDPFPVAPEICVEIESSARAEPEWQRKVRSYLDAGAQEVWLVDVDGAVRLFGPDGPLVASAFDVDASAVAYDPSKA